MLGVWTVTRVISTRERHKRRLIFSDLVFFGLFAGAKRAFMCYSQLHLVRLWSVIIVFLIDGPRALPQRACQLFYFRPVYIARIMSIIIQTRFPGH
jgi:hypothetical protein